MFFKNDYGIKEIQTSQPITKFVITTPNLTIEPIAMPQNLNAKSLKQLLEKNCHLPKIDEKRLFMLIQCKPYNSLQLGMDVLNIFRKKIGRVQILYKEGRNIFDLKLDESEQNQENIYEIFKGIFSLTVPTLVKSYGFNAPLIEFELNRASCDFKTFCKKALKSSKFKVSSKVPEKSIYNIDFQQELKEFIENSHKIVQIIKSNRSLMEDIDAPKVSLFDDQSEHDKKERKILNRRSKAEFLFSHQEKVSPIIISEQAKKMIVSRPRKFYSSSAPSSPASGESILRKTEIKPLIL